MKSRKRAAIGAFVVLALAGAACGGGSTKATGTPSETPTETHAACTPAVKVSAKDFEFDAKTVTIKAGECVQWEMTGSAPHTVTADDKSYDSLTLGKGKMFSHTYATAGTYPYYCTLHGSAGGKGMAGTVVVN